MRLEAQRLTVDCLTRLPQCPSAFTTSKRRIRTVGATKQGASINVIRLVSFRKRPPLLRGAKRSARQRSRHHCQQLGNLLRVAGGEGSDATAGDFNAFSALTRPRPSKASLFRRLPGMSRPRLNQHISNSTPESGGRRERPHLAKPSRQKALLYHYPCLVRIKVDASTKICICV